MLISWLLTVLALILFPLGLVLYSGYWKFNRRVGHDVNTLFSAGAEGEKTIVTAAMLTGLPEPVQRYLCYSGIVGKPLVKAARLKQVGRIRQDTQQPWMPFEAKEYYSVVQPGFVWDATMRIGGLPLIRGEDQYQQGKGGMYITIAGLRSIVDAKGEAIDQGSMMRYLNEMAWFPSGFLGKNITWKAIDDHSAEVTFTDQGKSISATLCIDDEGKLTNFVAQRYRSVDGGYSEETWSTPFTAYGEFEGLKLPVKGKGVWNLKAGDLEYIEVEVIEIQYDTPYVY